MLIVRSLRKRLVFFMNPIISSELTLFAQKIQRFFSSIVLKGIAKKVGFVQQSSKYQADELIALCVWFSQEGFINALFNTAAVAFLREVFTSLLTQKLCLNRSIPSDIISTFKSIRILDATVFQLPNSFSTDYQGSGGRSNTTGVKIQFEYDLLSGQFSNVQLGPGKNNDKTYGTTCLETVKKNDLYLRDLGYFDLGDLQSIHDKKAYYILRLKLNTRIYIKNPEPEFFNNGTIKKQTEYIKLDMVQIMFGLTPDETIEIPEAYIGQNQKLPARVIFHQLTDNQTQTRLKNKPYEKRRKALSCRRKVST